MADEVRKPPSNLTKALKAWDAVGKSENRPSESTFDKSTVSAPKLEKSYPEPGNELERLAYLKSYQIFDTDHDERFDNITRLASKLFACPIVLVSLLDDHRQWFKSNHGLPARETPKDQAFCCYAIADKAPPVLVVEDTAEEDRFRNNPLVTGDPHIRFYAGAPLILNKSRNIKAGTLCVIDRKPRIGGISEEQQAILKHLAQCVVDILEAHKITVQQELQKVDLLTENGLILGALANMESGAMIVDNRTIKIIYASPGLLRILNSTSNAIVGRNFNEVIQVDNNDAESTRQLEALMTACRLRSQMRASLKIRKHTMVSEALGSNPVPLWIRSHLTPIIMSRSSPSRVQVEDQNAFSLLEVIPCADITPCPGEGPVQPANGVTTASAAQGGVDSDVLSYVQSHGSQLVEAFSKVRVQLGTLHGVSKQLESSGLEQSKGLASVTKSVSHEIAQLFDGMVKNLHQEIRRLTPKDAEGTEGQTKRLRLS